MASTTVAEHTRFREIELKFAVLPSFDLRELEESVGLEVQQLSTQSLHSTYYDTVDLRLARNGVSLRYRRGEDGSLWTLKLPTDDKRAAIRDEIDLPAPPGDVPAEAIDLVGGFTRMAALDQVATLETKRSRWKLIDGETELALVYHDEVAVVEEGRVLTRFREIELESLGVGFDELRDIGDALRASGARPSEPVPKVVRALGPRATAPPDVPAVPDLSPKSPAVEAIRASLARSVQRVITNHAAARLGDDEGVHQMRVGVRRLRSDLRTFAPLVDPIWSSEVIPELEWLADLLGGVRDLDVLMQRLDAAAADLRPDIDPLFTGVTAARERSRNALYEGLRSKRYGELLERLVRSAQNPPVTPEANRPCSRVLVPPVAATWKQLEKAVRKAGKEPDEDHLHKIRIRAKRVRYAAEAVAPALGNEGRKASDLASAAARLQDVLGEHQDAVVAEARIRDLVAGHPDGSFALAAGRLIERQSRSAAEAGGMWREAWKQLDRKKFHSWLQE